uniref:Integrase zinc-binding domain-containing protein n=1 Tax=Photinus pyralis TaxID=7054 RepID=A0A1Y1LA97_PHOPY
MTMTKKDMCPRVGRWLLKLQEFDFEVKHRSGSQMKHVDALSRSPTEETRDVEAADLKINSIRIDKNDWLLTMQLQDNKINELAKKLKESSKNEERQLHEDYKIDKHGVYRKIDGATRWLVPKSIIWRVIQDAHDGMGHYGIEKNAKLFEEVLLVSKNEKEGDELYQKLRKMRLPQS